MSQRILIVGVSESGKTSLANSLIKNVDVPVFVRDPIRAQWAKCDGYFDSSDDLKELIRPLKGAPCVVVVDECADFFAVGLRENHWIFTRGRHDAMLPISIGQRIKMMAPNVREQASDLYVFESSIEASKILAEAYNCPDLEAACELGQGEYFYVHREEGRRICTAHALW